MALALIVLAIGSVLAGYVGVPAALGGHNEIEHYLAPSFAAHQGERGRHAEQGEPAVVGPNFSSAEAGRTRRAGQERRARRAGAERNRADVRLHPRRVRRHRHRLVLLPPQPGVCRRCRRGRRARAHAAREQVLRGRVLRRHHRRAHRLGVARRAVEGRRRDDHRRRRERRGLGGQHQRGPAAAAADRLGARLRGVDPAGRGDGARLLHLARSDGRPASST